MLVPKAVIAVTAPPVTRAISVTYSISVAPSSSLTKFLVAFHSFTVLSLPSADSRDRSGYLAENLADVGAQSGHRRDRSARHQGHQRDVFDQRCPFFVLREILGCIPQ